MTTSIKLIIDVCSMGDSSETAIAAFTTELNNAIAAEYPAANIDIKMGSCGRLDVSSESIESTDRLRESVRDIISDVWENGDWNHIE
ncbi:DinI-like family protein [Klebsiella oxytoca]|uniref:DinI-like family protein n=1 Tax=Klebsiella oxytoca TaxID=571 RepID=UPI0025507244|nr:DinI-like family protein [Klebsiella oxytoca]MEC5504979.1 DinI-like family protein [Klebsiella oxytoca]